jgi:hypothetical protein
MSEVMVQKIRHCMLEDRPYQKKLNYTELVVEKRPPQENQLILRLVRLCVSRSNGSSASSPEGFPFATEQYIR